MASTPRRIKHDRRGAASGSGGGAGQCRELPDQRAEPDRGREHITRGRVRTGGVAVFLRHRDRAVRPDEAVVRRLVKRAIVRRADRQQPAFTLDHHGAHIGGGRPHKRDAARLSRSDHRSHVFGAAAGLAKAASREQQPDAPIARRRFLRVSRLLGPIVVQLLRRFGRNVRRQAPRRPIPYPLWQRVDPIRG